MFNASTQTDEPNTSTADSDASAQKANSSASLQVDDPDVTRVDGNSDLEDGMLGTEGKPY
jgi:hypothetical protein